MRLLLDTHVWLWWMTSPSRLPHVTGDALGVADNSRFWSAACAWEIGVKYALGKLPLPVDPREFVRTRMVETGASGLPVTHEHALVAAALPLHHRDPFDRLLVAQAQVDGLTLVTGDPQMAAYDVPILWD